MSADHTGYDEPWDDPDGETWDPPDDAESETLPCPACGQPVYEDVDRCPYCGDWIMPLRHASGHPVWGRVVGVVVVVALLIGLCGGLIRWLL